MRKRALKHRIAGGTIWQSPLGLALAAFGGCALLAGEPVEQAPATRSMAPGDHSPAVLPPRAEPKLAAAYDRDINLFGELPERPEAPYFTRTATSLLQHTFTEEGADFDPSVSADGRWLVFASTRHNEAPAIYYQAVDGVAITQLTADPAADVQPAISPDGKRVAFASNRAGNWDIWVVGMDGQPPVQITAGSGDDVHPSWSPDGKHLVYCSLPPRGQWELWVADAADGGTQRFIGYGVFPEWAPTGDTIVFQRGRERGSHRFSIWTIQLVNGEPRFPTEIAAAPDAAFITPSWSRDGAQLAFAAVTPSGDATLEPSSDRADIWIVGADGRGRIKLTDGHTSNFSPTWSPDGRIFFTSSREGHETIWSLRPLEDEGGSVEITAGEADHWPVTEKGRGG